MRIEIVICMPELAVFTVGANKVQIERMKDYAKNEWDFAGEYKDVGKLVNNARLKRFDHVLVIDFDALGEDVIKLLKHFDVEVISFKEQKKLEKKLEEEKNRRRKETEVRIRENGDYVIVEEMK